MNLHLDWCSHEAAKYACEKWHYSKSFPCGKTVKIGVWEEKKFIGVIIFSSGANFMIGKPYNLKMTEICELTRVALTSHKNQVSKIVAISIKILRKFCPKLRLIVSYADPEQNHVGAIYQAMNWVFVGRTSSGTQIVVQGQKRHRRSVDDIVGCSSLDFIKKNIDPKARKIKAEGKLKYLMPLDNEMHLQIQKLAKPYPKKVKLHAL